jgi:hypothetical protein
LGATAGFVRDELELVRGLDETGPAAGAGGVLRGDNQSPIAPSAPIAPTPAKTCMIRQDLRFIENPSTRWMP